METVLDGGFAAPVLQSQTAFRAIMDALANPGTVHDLAVTLPGGGHLTAELATVLLTLCDHDTPVWLPEAWSGNPQVRQFVGFHTGAQIVSDPARAAFAFAGHSDQLPPFASFNLGTQEYPDRSTTIVLALEALDGGQERTITGPGIKGHHHVGLIGLPPDFTEQWAANRDLFPRGIDLVLVADGQVMGLPRSTRFVEGN